MCDTFGIVVTGGVGDTNAGGRVVMSMAFSMLMVKNCAINSFVHLVASACSCSPASMLWSLSASIAMKVKTFYEFGRGRTGGNEGYYISLVS
jgi:hypothetical protein